VKTNPSEPENDRSSQPTSKRGQFGWSQRVLFGLIWACLLFTLLLGGCEMLLRWMGVGHSASFFRPQGKGHVVENEAFIWSYHGIESPLRPHPFRFLADKPEGVMRLFILGESAALGTPEPAFGFGRMLEKMLQHRYPERKFEVVNLAMRGINSHMIRLIAAEARAYDPDLVIVYAGNNELVGWQAPEPDQRPLKPLGLIRAQEALMHTRLGQWLWQRIGVSGSHLNEVQDTTFFRRHHLSVEDPRREEVHARFAENMNQTIQGFVDLEIPVLMGPVLVNERDFPPLGSPSSARGGAMADSVFGLPWWEACSDGSRQWLEENLPILEGYLQTNPVDAQAHYVMARALESMEAFSTARVHYQAARDYDLLPFRATTQINRTLKELAEKVEGVDWVELDAYALRGEEEVKTLGDAWFHEHVHFRFEGDYRLAAYFYPHVQKTLRLPTQEVEREGLKLRSLSEVARDLGYTPISEALIERSILDLLAAPPFLDQWMHALRLEEREARWQQRFSIYGKSHIRGAIDWIAEASQRFPGDWHLPILASRLADRLEDQELALQWAMKARDLMPHASFPRLLMARHLLALDRTDEAQVALHAILESYPQHPQARRLMEQMAVP